MIKDEHYLIITLARSSISSVSTVTSTEIRSSSVGAKGVGMTVVNRSRTFIDIYKDKNIRE